MIGLTKYPFVLSNLNLQETLLIWNTTSSDIQDTKLRNWQPRNRNRNKSNKTFHLWNLSEGQVMKKQQESGARGKHLIWPEIYDEEPKLFSGILKLNGQLPPSDLKPRSANRIRTVLIARPRSRYKKPRPYGICTSHNQSFSHWRHNGPIWYNI